MSNLQVFQSFGCQEQPALCASTQVQSQYSSNSTRIREEAMGMMEAYKGEAYCEIDLQNDK